MHPCSAECAPKGLAVCFQAHTQTTPSLQPPKQSLRRCTSPSIYLSVVDMDLKINKCPLFILLVFTSD